MNLVLGCCCLGQMASAWPKQSSQDFLVITVNSTHRNPVFIMAKFSIVTDARERNIQQEGATSWVHSLCEYQE